MHRAAVFIAIGFFLYAGVSNAQDDDYWGAIAVAPDGGHGAMVNARSRHEAEEDAMEDCRRISKRGSECEVLSVESSEDLVVVAWYCGRKDNENGIVTRADDVEAAKTHAEKVAKDYGYSFDQCQPLIAITATKGYEYTTGKSFP